MFRPDQKIFAKVRGYPPWPAKICDLIDETPNKQKYRVYFYGTKETAICKVDELYDYLEHRERYGRPLKRKHFSEAIDEIEQELEPSFRKENVAIAAAEMCLIRDSDDEGNLIIDESPALKLKNKVVGDGSSKLLKRKLSSGSTDTLPTPPPQTHPELLLNEITSRSGRKIKPKKFLDEPNDTLNNAPPTPPVNKIHKLKSFKETNSMTMDADEKLQKYPPPNQQQQQLCDGNGFKDKVELHWDSSQNIRNLINTSEHSYLPKTVKKDFKKTLKKKIEDVKFHARHLNMGVGAAAAADSENLELLKIEVQLLDADCRIKSSLNLLRANCDECLSAMDEILDLKLNALMLKKHPEVVDTVKKLRKYVGNLSAWNLSLEEERSFNEGANKIRIKADHMYNKFQSLFTIPNGKSFFEVYSAEVSKFQEKTINLPINEIYGLVEEPLE